MISGVDLVDFIRKTPIINVFFVIIHSGILEYSTTRHAVPREAIIKDRIEICNFSAFQIYVFIHFCERIQFLVSLNIPNETRFIRLIFWNYRWFWKLIARLHLPRTVIVFKTTEINVSGHFYIIAFKLDCAVGRLKVTFSRLPINCEFFHLKIIQNLFTAIINAIAYSYIFWERCYQIFFYARVTSVIIVDHIPANDANSNNNENYKYVLKLHFFHPFRKNRNMQNTRVCIVCKPSYNSYKDEFIRYVPKWLTTYIFSGLLSP